MKQNLLVKAGMSRLGVLILMLWCGIFAANAIESDDINAAILVEGSVPVKWTNDATNPWYIVESTDGNYVRTPETEGNKIFTSTLSFTYTSAYPTEITFSGYRNTYYNEDKLTLKIDGEEKAVIQSGWRDYKCMISAGAHTVEFVSVSTYNVSDDSYYSGIRNLRVWECKELETACLADDSMPLTFENDPEHMWITENGYIRSTNENVEGESTSKISTTFTIDKPSLFSFEFRNQSYYNHSNVRVYVDDTIYQDTYNREWQYGAVVLYPGTHTIVFEDWHEYRGSDYVSEIRNVRLDQTWYEVTLNNPGELGVRLLQALGDKNLQDAELVKINGNMNTDDWATIKQLTGIKAIDFTGTNITEMPDNSMQNLSLLSTVMLPETVVRIGNSAFYDTNMFQITIPASVEVIGESAFSDSRLEYITFEQNSKLKSIGFQAFYKTYLYEFIMPDSVTEFTIKYYRWGAFNSCKNLKKLHLSEGLTSIPPYTASGCKSLEEIEFSSNIIEIGEQAFYGTNLSSLNVPSSVSKYGGSFVAECKNLKEVTLSSHCWNMNYWFNGCTALEKVVLPCATPPSIENDPFWGVTKSTVQLYVPDFALEAYRADPYWYNFTNAAASDEASVNDYWAIRGSLTLDSSHVMRETPSVEMMQGGSLVMDADATQAFNAFTYNTSEVTPAVYLSKSNSVTAGSVECRFYVDRSDRWYFFSPLTDVNLSDVTYPATDSWVIRYYDGARRANQNATSGNWVNMPADGVLKRGEGYIIQAKEAGWLYMPAAAAENSKFLGSEQVTMELADNACETAENAGWNFVANPYPCYYDIYYIDMQAPITVWTGSTYRAYSLNDGDRGDDTFVLRPMQPFFVQKATAGLTTGMPLIGRQINTTIDRSRAPRPETIDINRHKLNLELYRGESEEADDYTRVVINEEASLEYETIRDASKFMSLDSKVAQLYTIGDKSHAMAINERPYAEGSVALGVYLPVSGETYRISARRADRKAWIYDSATGVEQDLTEGDYIFTAAKAGADNSRFTIRFAPGTNEVEGIEATDVKVTGCAGLISINAPAGSDIAVYSADGVLVANINAAGGITEVPAAAGIYVVKVGGKTVKTIVK